MRVPESAKINLAVNGLARSGAKSQTITEQLASGKRVNRPSDDPIASNHIEAFKADIAKGENALRNIGLNRLWLDTVDLSTGRMVDILRYAKVKALEGANSFQSPESLAAIAKELAAMRQELLELGNTKINDVYIYAGSKTFTAPLSEGWPYQLPGFKSIDNLLRTEAPVDDLFIANLLSGENAALAEDGTTTRGEIEFTTLWAPSTDQAPEPMIDQASGALIVDQNPYQLANPASGAFGYKITIDKKDNAEVIAMKLNNALASKYAYSQSDQFPSGFKQDAYAYVDQNQHIYLQAMPGVTIGIPDSLKAIMPLFAVNAADPALLPADTQAAGYFGEYVEGFSTHELIVRITKGGPVGEARYMVSDDGGLSWSQNQQLNWQNEIYNPDGRASTQTELKFIKPNGSRFLPAGLEFYIAPNPSVIYHGNDAVRRTPQDDGYKTNINLTAKQLLFDHQPNGVNVFNLLENLQKNAEQGSIVEIGKQIKELDLAIDQVLQQRAKSGVTTQTIDNAENRIEQKNLESTKALAELEDADLAKLATDLNLNAVQRQAMMETTARVIQPSLVQFLR